MSKQPVYISQGRVCRSKPIPTLSPNRCVFILLAMAILVVTNPANGYRHWIPEGLWNDAKLEVSWLPRSRSTQTNHVAFLLTRTRDTISATALLNTIPLCEFPSDNEFSTFLCTWLDDNLCHGKPILDFKDLPYTVHRLLCWAMICSMVLSFCAYGRPVLTSRYPLLDSLVSVLDRPTMIELIQVNHMLYPVFVSMYQLNATYFVQHRDFHFCLCIFGLVFVIGAVGNVIGSYVQQERVYGMKAALAAALGYHLWVYSTWRFFRDVSSTNIFWLEAFLLLLSHQLGPLAAWMTGGMMGFAFGRVHEEWLVQMFFDNTKAAIRTTFRKWMVL